MRTEQRLRAAALIGAGAVVVALAGCTSFAATPPTVTSVAASSASPTPTAAPLACDDLVQGPEIAAALAADGQPAATTVSRTSLAEGSLIGVRSIEGAGGLGCAWTTSPEPAGILSVALLPDAADDWTALLNGDGPDPARRTFGGISAAADCGDPGCTASMVVGSTWVRIDLLAYGNGNDSSIFGRESTDTVFAHAKPAIEAVVAAVQAATPAQLRFPDHLATSSAPTCTSVLPTASLAKAMRTSSAAYDTSHQPTGATDSIVGAAEHRIGTVDCFAQGAGSSPDGIARITLDPGQAWAVADLAGDEVARDGLAPTTIAGLGAGEQALSSCAAGSTNQCTVILTLHGDAIQVDDTSHPLRIAEAIVAAAG